MRLFKFIKWWWKRNDNYNRVVVSFLVLWALPCSISAIWIGKFAFELILFGLFGTIALCAAAALFYALRSMWRNFNEEVPPDDIKIVNRLKGVKDGDPLGGM